MPNKGLFFITRVTFSAVSSVDIDGCFSASYKHYLIKGDVASNQAASTVAYRGQLRSGGSNETGSNYRWQQLRGAASSSNAARFTGETYWNNVIGDNKTGEHGFFETHIFNPFESLNTTAFVDFNSLTGAGILYRQHAMAHDLTSSYDGIRIFPEAGTITGDLSVWGYAL